MYICVCNSVTEKDIRKAVDRGVDNLSRLKSELKCSSQCGSCQNRAEACLNKALEKRVSISELVFS